ncbi:multidrug effflux MFS transporter [Azovibrio restrictus]|uniref:multidrug effflux MFS transporter n=1 Tax=Azovibrio restrictus TaxID=146938 RepID=UPI0026F16AFB|nr:multidrug effflux MFS transporter [Azovibrio restrictus]
MNSRQPTLGLTVLLAALAAVGPFSIDTYLPAFPQIGAALQADNLAIQQTLSIYLFTFSLMTLWHGALSDSFGRRPVILAGVAVYGLASLGCTLASSIEMLWLMRGLQGFSAGAGMVVSRAMVRDLYAGPAAQRLMSHIAMMFAVAPAMAPMIGGWLLGLAGWRATFAFLALMALALWLACWQLLPESLAPEKRQPLSPGSLLRNYRRVLGHGGFLAASIGIGCSFGGFFVYVLSAPVFLMEHLGLGPRDFHWLFVPATAGMMGGAWLSGRVASRWSSRRTLSTAFALTGAAALLNLLAAALLPPLLLPSLLPIPLYTLGMSLAMPTLTLRSLDIFPDNRGMAASCQSFLQTLLSAGIAAFVAPALWASRLGLALGMAGLGSLGVLLVLAHFRRGPPAGS